MHLCCLSLSEIQTLDLSTTEDASLFLEVLAVGDEVRALDALSRICTSLERARWGSEPIPTVIKAGREDSLYRAMKHESERIRAKAILAITHLLAHCTKKQLTKAYKYKCIVTLVELINSDESWNVKETAILALARLSVHARCCKKVLKAGGITAILNHWEGDSVAYIRTVCATLHCLLSYRHCAPSYQLQVAPFTISYLNAFDDIKIRAYIFRILGEIVPNCVNNIGLNEDISNPMDKHCWCVTRNYRCYY